MKKLYMLMIIIFSIFVVFDVNAQYLSFSDFKDIEKHNFSSAPATQESQTTTGSGISQLSSGFYGNELDNQPSNKHNYIIFGWDFSAYIRNTSTGTHDGDISFIASSGTYWIKYDNDNQYNCDYLNGYIYCPYDKNARIDTLMIRYIGAEYYNVWGSNDVVQCTFYFKSRIKITYYYGNLVNNQSIQDSIDNQTDIISNDDTTGNASGFSSDINNFDVPNDSHALDILGTLQNFVGNIQVSGACSRISVPIPFTDKNFILPCMTTDVYSVHFRELVVIWQIICRGVGYYYILVNVLKLVKETLDPFNFKLEVLDL